jgi:S-(hydroxymethyl)glutathione dehydrogenase/alcohol dehydrogenase
MVMKAAVCYEHGKPLVVEEVILDPPQAYEVKVKLKATAVCHSDVHQIRGEWGGSVPIVAGHEAAGIVEELGPQVTSVQVGDHVVVSLLTACGRCPECRIGASHLCKTALPHMVNGRLHTLEGQPIEAGIRTAAFAEYVVVHETQVVPIPPEIPFDSASLLACGVITGLGAVVNTAKVAPGDSVVVIGAGGVGLNAIQGANLSGANPIIAIDLLANKLEAARRFGATHTLNGSEIDVGKAVRQLTNGLGADYVFITVGSPAAMEQGYKLSRTGGSVVFVGIPDWKTKMPLPIGITVAYEKKILGSFMGSTRLQVDVPKLVSLYQNGRLQLDELITGRYSLDQINEAIANMEEGHALRNVIIFD